VKGGWDPRGGLRWGTKAGVADRFDRTVSATAAGALAATLLYRERHNLTDLAWAKKMLDWIRLKVGAPSGLVRDGLKADGSVMPTVWTYNTGVPIRAACEYFRETKEATFGSWAIRMGEACLDRSLSPLYDGAVKDPAKRYWWDAVYFVQYLADGMRELSRTTNDPRFVAEARREAEYIKTYLRDQDGLYWRNMRLWTIDAERTAAFTKLTGQPIGLIADASERASEPAGKTAEERPMAKTLLANAGAARMFWLLAH
jgi:predicted alpha-1,6-mannanase (GH76 family)